MPNNSYHIANVILGADGWSHQVIELLCDIIRSDLLIEVNDYHDIYNTYYTRNVVRLVKWTYC